MKWPRKKSGKQFQIQIAGERIPIPAKAIFNIEHEREREATPKRLNFNSSGNYNLMLDAQRSENLNLGL